MPGLKEEEEEEEEDGALATRLSPACAVTV